MKDTSRNRDAKQLREPLRAAAFAAAARLGPRLAAAATPAARAVERHFERRDYTRIGLATSQLKYRAFRGRTLLGKKRTPNAVDGARNRGKINHDLVGETAGMPDVFVRDHRELAATERRKRVPSH
jgi:hypothetical protein